MVNSVDPDQTAPIGAVCSGSTLLASILHSSVMLVNRLQQMTSANDIFRCIFFLGVLKVNAMKPTCMIVILAFYLILSYDVAPGSEITPCNKFDKPLVVYRFTGNVMMTITTLRTKL